MNKKIVSSILAGACALSCMSISAFAEDAFVPVVGDKEVEKAGSVEYSFNVDFEAPAINVTLPTTVKAVLNPYGIQVEIEDVGKTGKDGVTSPVYTIANNTLDFGIIVKATAKGADGTVDATRTTAATISDGDISSSDDKKNAVHANVMASIKKDTACASPTKEIPFVKTEANQKARELLVLTKATKVERKVVPAEGYFQIGGEISSEPAVAWDKVAPVKLDLILDIEAASADEGGAAAASAVGSGKAAGETT